MQRKRIVALLLIILFVVMIVDFRLNNEDVLADFFIQFETRSMHSITNINLNNETPIATYKRGFSYQAQDINNMLIDNNIGSVKVIGHNKEEIEVEYQINVFANNRELAEDFIEELTVDYEVIGDLLMVRTVSKSPKPLEIRGYEINFDIKAPQRLFVELKNRYGNTELRNFTNGVDLKAKYSLTTLSDLKGNIRVENDYGNLEIENLDGEISLNTSYNNNNINNLKGSLRIDTSYAQYQLKNIEADTVLVGKYGGGNIESVNGSLDFDIKYMGLSIDRVTGKISGNMEYGEVNIANVNNSLDLNTRYCDLLIWMKKDFKDLNVNVSTRYGDIKSDLDLPVIEDGNQESISGVLCKGQANLMINGSYADLELIYKN